MTSASARRVRVKGRPPGETPGSGFESRRATERSCGRGRMALGTSLPSWLRRFDSCRPLQMAHQAVSQCMLFERE
jgi:hypothetical protein